MPHNKPTASNADALTPVSQGLDNLFKSLITITTLLINYNSSNFKCLI